MKYTTKKGKIKNAYLISEKQEENLINKGWKIKIRNFNESEQQLYDRLSKTFEEVRIYETTTRVKGYHDIFAMVRGLRYEV